MSCLIFCTSKTSAKSPPKTSAKSRPRMSAKSPTKKGRGSEKYKTNDTESPPVQSMFYVLHFSDIKSYRTNFLS